MNAVHMDVSPEGFEANDSFVLNYEDLEAEIREAANVRRLAQDVSVIGIDADLTMVAFTTAIEKFVTNAAAKQQLLATAATIIAYVLSERENDFTANATD